MDTGNDGPLARRSARAHVIAWWLIFVNLAVMLGQACAWVSWVLL